MNRVGGCARGYEFSHNLDNGCWTNAIVGCVTAVVVVTITLPVLLDLG